MGPWSMPLAVVLTVALGFFGYMYINRHTSAENQPAADTINLKVSAENQPAAETINLKVCHESHGTIPKGGKLLREQVGGYIYAYFIEVNGKKTKLLGWVDHSDRCIQHPGEDFPHHRNSRGEFGRGKTYTAHTAPYKQYTLTGKWKKSPKRKKFPHDYQIIEVEVTEYSSKPESPLVNRELKNLINREWKNMGLLHRDTLCRANRRLISLEVLSRLK